MLHSCLWCALQAFMRSAQLKICMCVHYAHEGHDVCFARSMIVPSVTGTLTVRVLHIAARSFDFTSIEPIAFA